MPTACPVCRKVHEPDYECPYASSITCRRCHVKGHFTFDCTQTHHEAPTCLEELIPWDQRKRWGITSRTPFLVSPRGTEETEKELDDINRVVIPNTYKELTAFIEKNNIKVEKNTKASEESCMKALKKWALLNGKRLVKEFDVLG